MQGGKSLYVHNHMRSNQIPWPGVYSQYYENVIISCEMLCNVMLIYSLEDYHFALFFMFFQL